MNHLGIPLNERPGKPPGFESRVRVAVEGLEEARQVWSNNGTRRAGRGGGEHVLNAVN